MTLNLNTFKSIRFALFAIFTFCFSIGNSNSQNISVREIPALDKLPVNAIHRIFQDSEGYMWYGTFNGLCRYDGYDIKTFRADLYHPDLFKDNYITYINEDLDKQIWIGTYKGIYILNKETHQISSVDLGKNSDNWIFSINVTKDGSIWVSIPGYLYRLNSKGEILKEYSINYRDVEGALYFVYNTPRNEIIISVTQNGMYRLNDSTDTFEPYFYDPRFTNIERIIRDDKNDCYWLGTWGNGIVKFNPNAENKSDFYQQQPFPVDIKGEAVGDLFHMVQDDDFNYLWVTTRKNLFAFKVNNEGNLEQVNTDSFLPPNNRMLYEVIKDMEGKLWVSSFDTKSFIIDIHNYSIKTYALPTLRERIVANPAIMALGVGADGMLWLSQDRYGLCIYDPKTNRMKHYSECADVARYPLYDVKDILQSKVKNKAWIVPFGASIFGLRHDHLEIKLENKIDLNSIVQDPGVIDALYEDHNENLWIGTSNGLFLYRPKANTITAVSENLGSVVAITQIKNGKIWVVVKGKGIYAIDAELNIQGHQYDKDFQCGDITTNGMLWLGTDKGEIFLYDTFKNELEDYSITCGVNGDIINKITVDNYNHIWITSNQTIKEFNPDNEALHIYSTRNSEFLLTRILPKSVSYSGRGDLYFGGISGVVSISPSQKLEGIPEDVETLITNVKVMGKDMWENNHFDENESNLITLKPRENNLEIAFSSFDYHHLEQVRFAYKMEGVDKDWIYLDEGSNKAFYNKLDKGNYVFMVKATDKNGLWSNQITELKVTRLPMWYETWLAYLLYAIFGLGSLNYLVYRYLKRIEKRSEEKWADSAELLEMHRYVNNEESELSSDFTKVDKMLIDKATSIVESNLSEGKFNVDSLAESMNMSRSTLSRKIKLITNKTAFDFIKSIKMEHARMMFENKTSTVADVMEALGYSDYKNFAASFKAAFKVTPTEYQKKFKDQI